MIAVIGVLFNMIFNVAREWWISATLAQYMIKNAGILAFCLKEYAKGKKRRVSK